MDEKVFVCDNEEALHLLEMSGTAVSSTFDAEVI